MEENVIMVTESKYNDLVIKEIEYHELEERIDKSIEYIEKIFYVKSGLSPSQTTDLLNILKGKE